MLVANGKSKSTLNARMAFSGVENPSNKKKQRLVAKTLHTRKSWQICI